MRTKEDFIAELQSWHGTPYAHGVSIRGQGVDCVRFVVSMLEWLHGREASAECIPFNFPAQAAFCAKFPALEVFNWMNARYQNRVVFRKGRDSELPIIKPADVVVLEHSDDEPVHMMMGGFDGKVWHSNNWLHGGSVTWTGMTEQMRSSIWCVWRVDAAKGLE
jgi:hypothetical protein